MNMLNEFSDDFSEAPVTRVGDKPLQVEATEFEKWGHADLVRFVLWCHGMEEAE